MDSRMRAAASLLCVCAFLLGSCARKPTARLKPAATFRDFSEGLAAVNIEGKWGYILPGAVFIEHFQIAA